MTRSHEKHLDRDELDGLVSLRGADVSGPEQLSDPDLREAQRHVESCGDCSRMLQRHQFVHSEILRMQVPNPSPATPGCIGNTEWVDVAAGLLPEAKIRELMKHAAQCGHCGPLLKNAAEAIADGPTRDEEALFSSLRSARPDWRKSMATILRDRVRSGRLRQSWWRSVPMWPAPVYTFAAIAAVAIIAWVGVRILHPPSAEQLLAQAYSEHRTLEVRIAGAKYSPMQAQRGTERSDFDKPQSLLKAEELIGENLKKNPNDPAWLQVRARADLLNGNYDSAIKSLLRAQETQPDLPGLLTDLGSAYFVRAAAGSSDYRDAIQSFGEAVTKSPDDPIALFNLALASERSLDYTDAITDWQRYLQIDHQSDWSNAARAHLAALQEKTGQHEKSVNEPLLTFEEIARAGSDDSGVREKIDQRVEDYLNVAVLDWLPKAYPITGPKSAEKSAAARTSLAILADITLQKHQDHWLADLTASSSSTNFALALKHLSAALKENDTGDNVAARNHATEAGRLFASEKNNAGELRARVEHMFASQDAQDGPGCLKVASGLGTRLERYPYSWLKAQFLIESGNCTWISGNLGDVKKFFLRAAEQAERAAYGVIYLRTQDHLSLLAGEVGDLSAAWARTQKALSQYWAGVYPAMRGYNLYYDRYEIASSTKQPYLQMTVLRDAVALTESFDDNVIRAMAHLHMANAAVELSEMDLAKAEYSEASRLFAASPQIESTQIAHLEAETRMAGVQMRQGNTQLAINRLRHEAPEVAKHPTNYLSILYYSTLGEAETQAGHTQEADLALRQAVALANGRLHSLHDDKSRIEWVEQSATAYRDLVQQRLAEGDAEAALELWESFRGAELSGGPSVVSGSPDPTELHEVASRLPGLTNETVVSYAALPRGFAVWVYDDRGIWFNWIQGNPKIVEAQIERFRTLCADFTSDQSDVERNARNLYRVLFAPIEQRIPIRRLLVIDADDALAGLPFEALADEHGLYLADRFSIVASRGVYYRGDSRRVTSITPDSVAMIAAVPSPSPDLDLPLSPLPDALEEADAVAREFVSVQLLKGGQATAKAISSGLSNSQLFHFAGHALASSGNSGLLLSDSFLTAEELRKVPVPRLRLAVLSACETQDGSAGEGGDGDGLVRVFLAAGVPNVVASRWSVDSSATRQFMDLFYQNLVAGRSVADSIRQAQISIRSRSGMSHPFYWAAFTTFGLV